jgi:hypothetical protein
MKSVIKGSYKANVGAGTFWKSEPERKQKVSAPQYSLSGSGFVITFQTRILVRIRGFPNIKHSFKYLQIWIVALCFFLPSYELETFGTNRAKYYLFPSIPGFRSSSQKLMPKTDQEKISFYPQHWSMKRTHSKHIRLYFLRAEYRTYFLCYTNTRYDILRYGNVSKSPNLI